MVKQDHCNQQTPHAQGPIMKIKTIKEESENEEYSKYSNICNILFSDILCDFWIQDYGDFRWVHCQDKNI